MLIVQHISADASGDVLLNALSKRGNWIVRMRYMENLLNLIIFTWLIIICLLKKAAIFMSRKVHRKTVSVGKSDTTINPVAYNTLYGYDVLRTDLLTIFFDAVFLKILLYKVKKLFIFTIL